MAQKTAYAVFLLAVVALLVEVLLRWSGAYLLYTEQGGGNFWIEYGKQYENGHRFTHTPNQLNIHQTSEFDFRCMANELGYRDRQPEEVRALAGDRRPVLFIGDSFIDGVGAGCFGSMPHQFERLHAADSLVVVNAGISGSDVFYEYKVLEKDLPRINPGLVLQGVNHSDIFETVTRGGFERFRPGGLSVHRDPPVNLTWYRYSHLFRWYVHEVRRLARYTFLSKRELAAREAEAEAKIAAALARTDSLVATHGARLLVFFYPAPAYLDKGTPEPELERLHEACRRNGVQSLLLTEAFEHLADSLGQGFTELYWPFDGHYNEKGYGEFARILKRALHIELPY